MEKKKKLGYVIGGQDNDSYMFLPQLEGSCIKYKDVYKINRIANDFKLNTKKYDMSSTYDGYDIVSRRFKEFCLREKYDNIEFINLPTAEGFYWFKINSVIEFDTIKRGTRFIGYSSECDGYEEVIGATPAYLKDNSILSSGFYRTDISFGSFQNKSPLYMVDIETKLKLDFEKFKGVYFEVIYSG